MSLKLPVLRVGYKDTDQKYCESWENFLVGNGYEVREVDGTFDDHTKAATKKWQEDQGIGNDGAVGRESWGRAISLGFLFVADDVVETSYTTNESWPEPPAKLAPVYSKQREKMFGRIECKPAPTKLMPEAIKITNSWQKDNLTVVEIPQLKHVEGAPKNGKIYCHRLIANQLKALFQAWDDQGLMKYVLTWAGSWVPRYVRGSRTNLSNHAYGTAFDINALWNPMGRVPPAAYKKGSVRRLVQTANVHGFYWGGHYPNRPDGMHFEAAKII